MTGNFGQYEILSEIGRGGMGIVYQALRPSDGRIVAIKQLVLNNIDSTKEGEFRDRFKREAATAKRLQHPNIVKVFDVEIKTDNYFYVMEYLDGNSLRRYLELKGGRVTPNELWPILAQVIEGLNFAHTMNVVHRDVKPDNIFILKDGTVKITDFGIARVADFEETHLTKTGIMMGTLAYVSPEQLQDAKNVDHRADIFSLGAVAYEALSGQVPFIAEGIAQTIVKIVSQEEKPLHIFMPFINVETSACVGKALRKKARDRFRSVKEFARDYEISLSAPNLAITKAGGIEAPLPEAIRIVKANSVTNIESISNSYSTTSGGKRIRNVRDLAKQNEERISTANAYFNTPTKVPSDSEIGSAQNPGAYIARSKSSEAAEILRPLSIFHKQGKSQEGLLEPMAICYCSGKVIVADGASRLIHIFNGDGRWISDLSSSPEAAARSATGGGKISKPSAIAVDNKGRIYVSDSSDPYIRVFDSRGNFQREVLNIQGKEGGIQGMAIDSTDTLYVSDATNGCIQVFQSDLGLWLRRIGAKGGPGEAGQFQLPAGITTDRINQVYCADYGKACVFVYSKSGTLVRMFGKKGSGAGEFNVPRSVAVDNNDKIYVLDSLNHRVQVFTPTGEWFSSFGTRGNEPGQFLGPSDLSIDKANNVLFVADKGNKRIQVFELCLK